MTELLCDEINNLLKVYLSNGDFRTIEFFGLRDKENTWSKTIFFFTILCPTNKFAYPVRSGTVPGIAGTCHLERTIHFRNMYVSDLFANALLPYYAGIWSLIYLCIYKSNEKLDLANRKNCTLSTFSPMRTYMCVRKIRTMFVGIGCLFACC